jgi:hypothetical protein
VSRLLSICDWLPPDFGAVGQYALSAARARAAAGDDVVLAGLSSTRESTEDERIGAGRLRTLRYLRPLYDRASLRQRSAWTLRTNLTLLFRLRRELARADEVLFTGSPPFLVHLLVPLNLILRRRLTYRITDFYPEVILAARGRASPPLSWLLRWTVALRRRVDRFEALGEDQRLRLREIGIPDERIAVVPDPSPVAIPEDTRPLPLPPELEGRVVLLYSGNFGIAHEHETFVAGYRRHHREGRARVVLWLNATGSRADEVEQSLRALRLPVHRTRPVPLAALSRLLVTPAAHLITLRDAFVGFVLPSKVHGCVASRRPVLFVGSAASDVHRVCRAALPADAYCRADVGDEGAVYEALEALSATGRFCVGTR